MNADGYGQTRITINPEVIGNPIGLPIGSKITFTSDREQLRNPEIYVMNADGSGQTRLTYHSSGGRYFNDNPAWSPDGSKIAFHLQQRPS